MTKIILSLEKKEHFLIAEKVQDYVDGWKVNHIGWDIVAQSRFDEWAKLNNFALRNTKEVFFDCKLWDTPNTVKTVVEKIIERGATMTTVCTHNNDKVFKELEQYRNDIKLLGVTFLTSWTPQDQHQICRQMPMEMWRDHLQRIEGFYGTICSPKDVTDIDYIDFENLFKRVCPGITFGNNNSGQVRTTTPKQAQDLGADYIVIGRAVTESQEPIQTIKEIHKTLVSSSS